MTTARERRRQDTRLEIVAAAWAQAEEQGIAGISLRELATAVGMRAPSLYTYFDGKDAIYDRLFAEGYEALNAFTRELEADSVGLENIDALTMAAERFVRFCQQSPARYQLMFTRAIPGWEPSPDAYARSVESYREMAEALAGFGIEGDDALDLYTAVIAGLAAQQMANDPGGDRWLRLARSAMEMLVEHLERTKGDTP